MKRIFIFICILTLGCYQVHKQSSLAVDKQKDSLKTDTAGLLDITTAEKVIPYKSLPAKFALKIHKFNDSTLKFSGIVYFPQSNHDSSLNELIRSLVDLQIIMETPNPKECTDASDFEMWLVDFNTSKALISCVFRAQSYTNGAAHYNHWWVILNYDTLSKKKILFTDIFKFSKSRSKKSFCDKFAPKDDGSSEIIPKLLNSNTVYDVTNGQLTIYPNYICAMEDVTYSIDLKSVQDYIDPFLARELGLTDTKEK